MRVEKVCCKNFRNIENIEITPNEEMNVIWGENAQGKTNILESIWLFTGAKSFRGSKDIELIRFNSEKAKVEVSFISEKIKNEAKIEIKEKRSAFLNDTKLKSPSLLAGKFNAIIFSPQDLRIVTDGPILRRKFIDTAIGQIYPNYIEILKKYTRAVIQRNKTLKDYRYDSTLSILLDSFEEEIAQNGEKIVQYRKKYIKKLNEFLPLIYSGISAGKETLEIEYLCSFSEENLQEKLAKSRKEDIFSQSTSLGPHRDDLEFKINSISARSYASQGQKRSVALSLKLAEAEIIKNIVGESPIFLLDDVMSELDIKRQEFVLNHIKGMQTFITCCDPSNIKNIKSGKVFEIKNGMVI